MQHLFGNPCHRTTLWRRAKAAERKSVSGHKRGRGFSTDKQTESFLLFTGAVIELQNTTGECFYSQVFMGERQGQAGFVYHKVPDALLKGLAESKFPPQLLAVVVSDVIPLDKLTDRRRRILKAYYDQAENDDHFSGKANHEHLPLDSAYGIEDSSSGIDLKAMDDRNGWRDKEEPGPGAEQVRRLMRINKTKGTPVHRIDFRGGVKISRRMACYWRKQPEYNRCRKFILSLLQTPEPLRPELRSEWLAADDKVGSKKIWNILSRRVRNRARLAGKYKGSPKVEPSKLNQPTIRRIGANSRLAD